MERRIEQYLAHKLPDASDIEVDELHQIHGGSSQETFRFRARWRGVADMVEKRLILRRAPNAGLVEAERDLEYSVYEALRGSGIPVPGVHYLELDPAWLDRPFFIMDLCDGKPGHPYAPGDPYDGHGSAIAGQFWRHLGTLAKIDHRAVGLTALRGGKGEDEVWARELEHWERMIAKGETLVQPAVAGAIRWLRCHPPPPPQKLAIVHGDYRSGNFLFTEDGSISAILDWEMCHVGDPLEDIAWAIDPFWPMTRHLPLEQGLAAWEAASGQTVDRDALEWWRLFATVKATAIWTTAEASFASGESREMVIGMSATRAGHFHRKQLLAQMAERGAMG